MSSISRSAVRLFTMRKRTRRGRRRPRRQDRGCDPRARRRAAPCGQAPRERATGLFAVARESTPGRATEAATPWMSPQLCRRPHASTMADAV